MRSLVCALIIATAWVAIAASGFAQQPLYDLPPGGTPRERLAPGESSSYGGQQGDAIIGGRPGVSRPRVPIRTRPHGAHTVAPGLQLLPAPEAVPNLPVHVPNAWAVLFEIEDEGPANGLTLEQAVNQIVHANLSLKARSLEIPQAQADVLTAGMLANPVVFFDGQLIPYKAYNAVTNPGGPAQYDLNVSYPVDASGKRPARVAVACAAKRVTEALYMDAVRTEIDRLATAYIDALAARLAVRTTRKGLARVEEILRQPDNPADDPREAAIRRRQIELQRQSLKLALIDAEAVWKNSRRTLAQLLNLPREQIETLELRGSIQDNAPTLPPLDELVSLALTNRPDLAAYRLGVQRAGADVRLAQANRLPDVYVLYQPFTYQDNTPYNQPSSRSWAVGATMTVPIFDRNQGNIQRAKYNVNQSQLEAQVLEHRVINEVEQAYDDYMATGRGIEEIERELLPTEEALLGESARKFQAGKLDATAYLAAQRDLDDLGRQYRDLLVRHRHSMIDLNTAVGTRVLP